MYFNMAGQKVFQNKIFSGDNSIHINLLPGMYFYRIRSGIIIMVGKLIKE